MWSSVIDLPGVPASLILRWPFYVVYDERVDWTFGGFKLEAKLLLQRRKQRRKRRIRGCRAVGRPMELQIVRSRKIGLIQDRALQHAGQCGGKVADSLGMTFKLSVTHGPPTVHCGMNGGLKLRTVFCKNEASCTRSTPRYGGS